MADAAFLRAHDDGPHYCTMLLLHLPSHLHKGSWTLFQSSLVASITISIHVTSVASQGVQEIGVPIVSVRGMSRSLNYPEHYTP